MNIVEFATHHFIDTDLLCPEPICIDIGTCYGDVVREIKELSSGVRVYGYEPSKSNFKALIDVFNDVHLTWGMVSDMTAPILPFKEYLSGSKGFRKKGHFIDGRTVDQRYETVDYMIPNYHIEHVVKLHAVIDYIKIDAEGMGLNILRHIASIDCDCIKQISIEVRGDHREPALEIIKSKGWNLLRDVNSELYFQL